MNAKQAVTVRIASKTEGQSMERVTSGDVYFKGDFVYIRYMENEADMGRTATIVKAGRNRLRILRQGDIASEQDFAEGERLPGYYETPQGRMELAAVTDALSVDLREGLGTIRWSYTLYVFGDEAGRYELQLDIGPAAP